ncbi:energy transducer TonB [uncultured Endozoicomonas sp.]|uniref:energy transducer TonB n=1 Tax=uncultured Endozoicomonas sp. TaxID=432652 RepID=UPI0026321F32|nr:energy transducer TonB [uncultured Endozoicomonas sp.]
MPKKLLVTLLVSIAAHVAAVIALDNEASEPRIIQMGSIQAPVSLSFSTVTQPKVEETVVEDEVQPEPEIEVAQKPQPKAKPLLKKKVKKKEPPKKKPEPKKPEVVEKPKPVEKEQKPVEPAMERTAIKESVAPGLSDEPVMVSEPAIQNWVEPRYPKLAQRRNQQGVVMLDVVVDERGAPLTIDILESSGYPVLDKAAIDAVKRWSFKPEQRNSQFVKSRVHIPVAFEIS